MLHGRGLKAFPTMARSSLRVRPCHPSSRPLLSFQHLPAFHPKQSKAFQHPSLYDEDKMLTVSMASLPFSFSLVFIRALALAVVERTAVLTFSTVSFTGGVYGAGYANAEGLA